MIGKRQTAVADSAATHEVLVDAEILETEVEFASPLAWSIESARLVEEAYRIDRAFEDRLRLLEAELERTRDENAMLEARVATTADYQAANADLLAKIALLEPLAEKVEAQQARIAKLNQEKVGLEARLEVLAPLADLLDNVWDKL